MHGMGQRRSGVHFSDSFNISDKIIYFDFCNLVIETYEKFKVNNNQTILKPPPLNALRGTSYLYDGFVKMDIIINH